MATALILACGCSASMKQLPSGWDGTEEPDCSSDSLPLVGDLVAAGIGSGIVLGGIEADSSPVVLVGVLITLPFLVGSVIGESRLRECREAKAAWRVGGAIGRASNRATETDSGSDPPTRKPIALNPTNDPRFAVTYWCSERNGVCSADESACDGHCNKFDEVWCTRYAAQGGAGYLCGVSRTACLTLRDNRDHRQGRSEFGECVKQKATGQASMAAPSTSPRSTSSSQPPSTMPTTAAAPRGFYCSSSSASPNAGFCTREKVDCQRARDAALAAVADLDECRLVETAFCFAVNGAERCAPTAAACTSRMPSAATCDEKR